jgi:uncharacterized protein YkwD
MDILEHHRRLGMRLVLVVVVLVALFQVGCLGGTTSLRPNPSPLPLPSAGPTDAEVISLVDRVNAHRMSRGLSALEWHPGAAAAALAHSRDMEDRGFLSHTNPEGDTPWDRLAEAGITYYAAGENIAWGYDLGTSVLIAWLASSGHRANIENGTFTHHGVVRVGSIWTHVFLRPRSTSASGTPITTSAPAPLPNSKRVP